MWGQVLIWTVLLELCWAGPVALAKRAMRPEAEIAFKRMQQHQLVFHPLAVLIARIDPIVSPGVDVASGHLHTIIGPSNINSNSTSDQLREANCTSLTLGDSLDLSAYWQPAIYHRNGQGKLSLLNMTSSSVYYNMESNTTKMVPFPSDFSMLVGNTTKDPERGPADGYITSDFGDTPSFPRAYTSKIGIHVQFPDCHDGKPFTVSSQQDHMVHSYQANCPPGWVKYPAIMLQFTYSAGSQADFPANPPDQPTYVLANGDTVGSSIHADFMNGWKPGVLQQVIDKCSDLGFGNTAKCPVFKSALGKAADQEAAQCRYDLSIPNEQIGFTEAIQSTPGDNALSNGTVPATGPPKAPPAVEFIQPTLYVDTFRPGGWPIAEI